MGATLYHWFSSVPVSDKNDEYDIIGGSVVVGFKKDVSLIQAEKILHKYNFEPKEALDDHREFRYFKTSFTNMGKIFQNETSERFILRVPTGEEEKWINIFQKETAVYQAGYWLDPERVQVE